MKHLQLQAEALLLDMDGTLVQSTTEGDNGVNGTL